MLILVDKEKKKPNDEEKREVRKAKEEGGEKERETAFISVFVSSQMPHLALSSEIMVVIKYD